MGGLHVKRGIGSLLSIALTAGMLLLSACGGGATNSASKGQNSQPQQQNQGKSGDSKSTSSNGGKKVEIFSWWTNGGEKDGLNALLDVFKKKYPDVEIVNAAIAGDAGSNAKAVLVTRMQGGDPPDTFQVHAGAELNGSWVAAGKMEPLNDIYQSEGWMDKFPKSLIDMISKDGKIYSVPVNIHRGNTMWYSKKLFEENNLKVPETYDEFFQVAETLKSKGITPFALGSAGGFESLNVFETVLAGTLGSDDYYKLFNGQKRFDSPEVKKALETYKRILSYVNEDHAARRWQDAVDMITSGKAGMTIMGDWVNGYYTSVGKKPGIDYGYAPAFGNKGIFMVVSDTFGLPKGIKHPEETKNFLKLLGSVEGQDAFNPKKGSIPARLDAGNGNYDVYLKDQMKEFKTNKLTPSIAHGSAAKESFVVEANNAMNLFLTQKDVDKAAAALQRAAEDSLK
jgi:glucose/mannose transport system substrate-binding protein